MRYRLSVGIAAGWVVLDQITKIIVRLNMPLGTQPIEVVPSFFNLTRVENKGAAFGLLGNLPDMYRLPFFTITSLIAVAGLVVLMRTTLKPDLWSKIAYGLILGGAIGNFIDRILFGSVTDFLEFYIGEYVWPNFNVADSGITVGITMIFLHLLLKPSAYETPQEEAPAAE